MAVIIRELSKCLAVLEVHIALMNSHEKAGFWSKGTIGIKCHTLFIYLHLCLMFKDFSSPYMFFLTVPTP